MSGDISVSVSQKMWGNENEKFWWISSVWSPTISRRYSAMKRCYGKINPLDWICKCRKNFQSGQNLGNIQNLSKHANDVAPNKFLIKIEKSHKHSRIKGREYKNLKQLKFAQTGKWRKPQKRRMNKGKVGSGVNLE